MDLTLREAPDPNPAEPVAAAAALLRAAQARPERALTQDERLTTLLARVQLLAGVMPELDLPALAEPASLLPSLVEGRRSFAELRAVDLRDALLSQLTHTQRRALDEHAPERWTVPSGASVAMVYTPGEPPLLAARVQQLFGLRRTPRIAAGRVPVKVQLLSPGNRPVQTTLDLESFWTKTWPEVRKELRGRYPRHAWPEDPTDAIPEDRPKRRGT
jgi:ATP-dependent helicase HrpB